MPILRLCTANEQYLKVVFLRNRKKKKNQRPDTEPERCFFWAICCWQKWSRWMFGSEEAILKYFRLSKLDLKLVTAGFMTINTFNIFLLNRRQYMWKKSGEMGNSECLQLSLSWFGASPSSSTFAYISVYTLNLLIALVTKYKEIRSGFRLLCSTVF